MKYQMYSIFDLKVGVYHAPIFFRSSGEAIRSFVAAATEGSSLLSKYPKDFSLYSLGEWSDETSSFDIFKEPRFVAVLHDLIVVESSETDARSAHLIETAKKDA